MTHHFGWRVDLPDFRDFIFTAASPTVRQVDLRGSCMPAVYDQGRLGSCTGQGIRAALEYDEAKEGAVTPLSSLFIYFLERDAEGTVASDAGASIRDGIKCVGKYGAAPEADWPYDIARFAERPPQRAYDAAANYKALEYHRVPQNQDALLAALQSGFPVVAGISVYESFESAAVATTGTVPMPEPDEQLLGGHCVLLVGADLDKGIWILRNSWNNSWGDGGYFTLPLEYLTTRGLASDFWVVKRIGV